MAERDFVHKLERAGFGSIDVVDRTPWGVAECSLYPLFDEKLIALMKHVIPGESQDRIGDSIVVTARLGLGTAPAL